MISAIGPSGATRATDTLRDGVARAKARAATGASGEATDAAPASPAAQLSALGAPIDTDKVARIAQAIAEGRYAIDPRAIADRMIATDLPA